MTPPGSSRIVASKERDVLTYERKGVEVMFLVVHHRVIDREKFLATDPQDIGGNAPPGVEVRHFLPARDASAADCLWEAESLDALRGYLDPATRESCENTYFEVDTTSAMGLPVTASARL